MPASVAGGPRPDEEHASYAQRHPHLDQPHLAGIPRRAARDVLLTLHTFRGHGALRGRRTSPWPIGHGAAPGPSSARSSRSGPRSGIVGRAARPGRLALAQDQQPVSVRGAKGVPISNSRLLSLIGGRSARPLTPTTGHCGRGGESHKKKEALDEMLRAAAAAPDLLLRRRLVIEGRGGQGLAS